MLQPRCDIITGHPTVSGSEIPHDIRTVSRSSPQQTRSVSVLREPECDRSWTQGPFLMPLTDDGLPKRIARNL